MPDAHNPKSHHRQRRLPPPAPLKGRPYRMAAVVHRYLPEHNAGAETMLHALLQALTRAGWEIRVSAREHRHRPYRWEGIQVEPGNDDSSTGDVVEWADVVITHLHSTRRAVAWCRQGRPLVHLVHNHAQLASERVQGRRDAAMVVWNSQWVADHWAEWPGPSILVRPPTEVERYRTVDPVRNAAGHVTLLNLTDVKGGTTFWKLVDRRPDLPFMGVIGAYYNQEIPDRVPANARLVENTPNVRDIYARTRVLLMPSVYESWGQTAAEAAASGIPILAASTPGLRECMTSARHGECAIFLDPRDVDAWADALRDLDDPRTWERWSDKARARSAELAVQAAADTDLFVHTMELLAEGRSVDRLHTGSARATA